MKSLRMLLLTFAVALLAAPAAQAMYLDDESDLIYYGYRYYNPSTGRWLNRDPVEENGGKNLYVFVQDNPINSFDRIGLITVRLVNAQKLYNGGFDVKWNFILDSPAPKEGGYIVQHVKYLDSIVSLGGQQIPPTTDDYYELWDVDAKCNFGHPPILPKPPFTIYDWTDNAYAVPHGSEAGTGERDQSGVIKFFLKSNAAINVSDFIVGGVPGSFDKPRSGGLKSTRKPQPWFDTTPPDDGEAIGNRDVHVTWTFANPLHSDEPNGDMTTVPPSPQQQ